MTQPVVAARLRDRATVVIIEDDAAVRESLDGLFRSVGLAVELFGSVEEYLAGNVSDKPGCMVLDVRLPGVSGLEFFEDLKRTGVFRSVVFISAHADVPMSVSAMKAGAVEFLTKPVRDQDLLGAVKLAIEQDAARRASTLRVEMVRTRFERLSAIERKVVALIVMGSQDKEIASRLGLTEAKAGSVRDQVMQGMLAGSLAELVRMIDTLDSPGA